MAGLITKKGLAEAAKNVGKAFTLAGVSTLHPGAGIALGINYVADEVQANIQMAQQEKEIEETLTHLEGIVERRKV